MSGRDRLNGPFVAVFLKSIKGFRRRVTACMESGFPRCARQWPRKRHRIMPQRFNCNINALMSRRTPHERDVLPLPTGPRCCLVPKSEYNHFF